MIARPSRAARGRDQLKELSHAKFLCPNSTMNAFADKAHDRTVISSFRWM
ncbi:MAG: hypothetical protein ACI8UD_004106 [Planctomycetota bacterium]|jgi:hypothetical protein